MSRYEIRENVIHLAYHTPDDWADYVMGWFVHLGCSQEYAIRASDKYRNTPLAP